jgi:hypothetical protein
MRKILGSLAATLAVALVLAALPMLAAATHGGSQGCATKVGCATSGLRAAVASAPDAAGHPPTSGVHDAGDHPDFSLPVTAAAPAGADVPPPSGMALDPDGLEGVVLPLNDTGSAALATVRTPDAPEFGFDVNIQAARPFFPDGIDPGHHVHLGVPTAMAAAPVGVQGDLDELVWGALWL